MRLTSLLLAACLLTAGCATMDVEENNNELRAKFQPWKGRNVSDLISAWGMPSAKFELPNKDVQYQYVFERGRQIAASRTAFGQTAMVSVQENPNSCKISVTSDGTSQTVKMIAWHGYCYADELP